MTNLIIACLLSGVASMVLGFIWYHRNVFGTAWMNEIGMTEADAQKGNMPMIFGLSFIITCYMAYEMKWINHPDPLPAIAHGMFHGAKSIGLFAAGAIIINGLYSQRSFKYIFITAGYWVVLFAIIGAILASFPSFKPAVETTDESTGMRIEMYEGLGVKDVVYEESYTCVRDELIRDWS